jgi:hypothetical protein
MALDQQVGLSQEGWDVVAVFRLHPSQPHSSTSVLYSIQACLNPLTTAVRAEDNHTAWRPLDNT